MIDYSSLIAQLKDTKLERIIECIPDDFEKTFNHGDLSGWFKALSALPELAAKHYDLSEKVKIGDPSECNDAMRAAITEQLMTLKPWRKGPYELFGIDLNTEWRSDWKWDRIKPHMSPLKGRTVLDVGCGNGYHMWRMAGEGAKLLIGADPHLLFTLQYWAMRHFLKQPPVYVIPVSLEGLPEKLNAFDTTLSMGVLYHRRSPFDHLIDLKHTLKHGGELVLETIVIDGKLGETLVPQGRYARMPNVWFLPSCLTLENWLEKVGFKDIRLVDNTPTTVDEQRTTEWMTFESFPEALDKDDPTKTIEGYPAPKRAVFIATKP